jgi:copper homeostasis protein
MSNKTKIEICVNSVETAIEAQKLGFSRVILCAGRTESGTTPSFGTIRMARQALGEAQLYVLIRPREGDYLYSSLEQEVMVHDVKVARQLGADGVVIGCLNATGQLDSPVLKKLMNAVGEMEVAFGSAFDVCNAPDEALTELIHAGVKRIITSGLKPKVTDALPRIAEWVKQVEGRILFVLNGGIAAKNVEAIADATQCREFHIQTIRDIIALQIELEKIDEKDAALEKQLKEAKAKKKKGRRSEDDDDF